MFAADEVHLAPDQRMDVGVDRIGERRDEHARAVRAHLVLVDEDLRKPLVVDGPRFSSCVSICVSMNQSRLLSWPT